MPNQKKIFINASTVKISGGLILAQNIVSALMNNSSFKLLITCPHDKFYQQLEGYNSKFIKVPDWMLGRLSRFFHDYFWLPYQIKKFCPDIVFTLGNIPAVTKCVQIYLHDNPYITERFLTKIPLSFYTLSIHFLRRYITYMRMKYVDCIIVQTTYQKVMLKAKLKREIPIKVIRPGIPDHFKFKSSKVLNNKIKSNYYKVACLSRYFEHKNIEILYEAAMHCNQQDLPIQFILTIEKEHGKKSKKLIERIKNNNQNNHILNVGEIEKENVAFFMHSIDALILPSFFETFGMNCIDAWYFKKPYFVADTQSLRSSCNEAAIYFNPESAQSIINSIVPVLVNKAGMKEIQRKGKEQLLELPKWENYVKILEDFSS
ncbi:MAG: glycosyltransferase [Bacteroidales bacterium]|nr:glycosyltransferase [Bacteroidales bacterium]